ncbi:Hypothetical protein PHPALM_1034 [Phytophthora palmivora]|uniref:Uncharacterized protein n=1 Tax=Phytophthora palmivora TaxID=4796 RepID=A0A2P4YTC1_9STRA|nr:Hypothetical protein PHPALM_1034 [Phytophthora palmivora]
MTEAIWKFQPGPQFQVLLKRQGEQPLILDWGIRVATILDGKQVTCWICRGSALCRAKNKGIQLFGNTSKATKHLNEVHFVTSAKIIAETGRRGSRQEELNRIIHTITNSDDCRRATLLLETLRVVNNNLPFRIGKYEEAELLSALTMMNFEQLVTHAVAELYHSGVTAVSKFLTENKIPSVASFAINTDFWVWETQEKLYVSIDSVGTRHLNPRYVERNGGIREPFRLWIVALLRDFGLTVKDVFGDTSDKGLAVKRMLESNLSLMYSSSYKCFYQDCMWYYTSKE